ncbi:MAG: T9SS type A sorting domain-containing protein [Bacteroidota bacterium]
MKKIYLFSLLFLSGYFLQAQNFASPDASWVFSFNGTWSTGITQVVYEKDTLIDNRSCRKFLRQYTRENTTGPLLDYPIYFYVENGKVEFSTDAIHFDLLYNFRGQFEQKWKIYRRIRGTLVDSLEAKIEAVYTTQINGINLRTQSMRFTGLGRRQYQYVDVVYEEIGPTMDFFLPWDRYDRTRDGGEGGPLRCFHNNNVGLVQFDSAIHNMNYVYDCEQIVSISDVKVPSYDLKTYPNPVSQHLFIENNENQSLKFELIDLLGREVLTRKLSPGKNEWDVSSLMPGVYSLKVNGWLFQRILIS